MKRFRSTRPASSSTSAAARTSRPPDASRPSSCSTSPAPIGSATRRTRSCSASTARRSTRRKSSTSTCSKLEEAKKRDHRVLGKQLDLFSIQELAGPGLIFWHPKGGLIRKEMEDWMRDEYLKRGYSLVYHAARGARRSVEDLAATRATTRRTCSRPWNWTMRNTA